MSPKKKYTREEIVDTAFSLLRTAGFSSLTARSVAAELNASTMPIYSVMRSMENVIAELRVKTLFVLDQYQNRSYTDNPYLNRAIGYVTFAYEEKMLFRFLHIDAPIPFEEYDALQDTLLAEGEARLEWFGRIDENSIDDINLKSFFFVHGLAMSLSSGTVGPYDNKRIIRLLSEAGSAFTLHEKRSGEKR